MFSFLSNRVTAAHLAIAAVAPLVLCRHFGAPAVVAALIWLAAVAAVWAFMSPVTHGHEHYGEARRRVLDGTLSDPSFWVLLVLVAYAGVLALNGGVSLAYDDESSAWRLAGPAFELLPGGVTGAGGIGFAAALLVFVLYPAIVYSLDTYNMVDLAVFSSIVVAADALLSDIFGGGAIADRAVTYGLWSLAAAGAMAISQSSGWRVRELLAMLGFAGCLLALLCTGRPTVIVAFASAIVLFLPIVAIVVFLRQRWLGLVRFVIMSLASAAAVAALFLWRSGDWNALIPVWSTASDATLVNLAKSVWSANPWAGAGLGAFPIAAKLAAAPDDWSVLGAMPDFYRSGWLAFIAERGLIGAIAVAVAVGAFFVTWFRRARNRGRRFLTAALPLLPLAVAAFAVSMVFDGSGLQADALVAFAVAAAMSVNGGI